MDYLPEVIITKNVEDVWARKKQEYTNILTLYLLNKDRFYSIGIENLYDAVYHMEKYGFGKKYSVTDVLTKEESENPDKLFTLLFLLKRIEVEYESGLYGKVFRIIKSNAKILNASKYTIKKHEDKKRINTLLQQIFTQFNMKISIRDFLLLLQQMELADFEYIDEIIGDDEYSNVLEVSIGEFHKLFAYLQNPHISTQHGVKGESHDTVAFIAADNNRDPVVHMSSFLELWSMSEVSLPSFEVFYYDYKNLIADIETVIGMKCSKMRSENYKPYKEEIYNKIKLFAQQYNQSNYYRYLLQDVMERYLEGDGVTNAKNCLNENLVYGSLSAYRLFYVGCSRARKNLTIIIDRTNIAEFEEKLVEKLKWCGFKVVKK